ncbi:YcgN family cysteine cluster protein [Marivivens sp. LCG002]|uniref:YcgN family cysteine cluster protein n=1 Tax=Marivivens sp. LCG002 TaxID=3051171 RepID=UPI00255472A1|nr:YcgN family cysteine cluster protein [Marivivens sp. LCG002]WIV50101.1 YcgN family cysteine cluster protein [Marivivens sp. LCG002]
MAEIDRNGLRERFWANVPMDKMTQKEWEALCDGCGKCCLNKLEDEETGEVVLTRVACRLLDDSTCLCSQYPIRHQFVPECIVMSPKTIAENMYWLPQTCAYRLVTEGRDLYHWHPLISGDPMSVHEAGVSMRGLTVPEFEVDDDDWENHIIEEPT